MGGFVKAALDPAGIFGNWEDTPGGPAPAPDDGIPSVWQRDGGFIGGLMEPIRAKIDADNKFKNVGGKASQGNNPLAWAWSQDAHVKPADFSAQWQYQPGKGPQWIEPVRVSSDNNVPWAAQVNNGPAKKNRI